MNDYCFNYQVLCYCEWWQRCIRFEAADDQEAVEYAKSLVKGITVKDAYLIPYERLVRI